MKPEIKDITQDSIRGIFKDVSPEQVEALLASGILSDLRDADITKIDRDKLRNLLGIKQPSPGFLEQICTIKVPARRPFVARESFLVDVSNKAKVKIEYLNHGFQGLFLGKIEKPAAEATLRCVRPGKAVGDAVILQEIGESKAETTLGQIFALLELQPKGEPGVLLTDGYENIFYVRSIFGTLLVLVVYWLGEGWRVISYPFTAPHARGRGDRLFLPNC